MINSALTILRKCDGCLQDIDNETSSDQENVCSTLCNTCFEKKELCQDSKLLSLEPDQWNPTLRPCDRCLEKNRHCERMIWVYLCSDCLEKQKKVFRDLNQTFENNEECPAILFCNEDRVFKIFPSPDNPHTDKNFIAAYDNYLQWRNGEIFCSNVINALREHSDPVVSEPFKKAISKESLLQLDRMSNQVLMDNVSSDLEAALQEAPSVLVSLSNCVREPDSQNKRKKVLGEHFEALGGIRMTSDCKIFCTDVSKNQLYESDIGNPPTVRSLLNESTKIVHSTDVAFAGESPRHLIVATESGLIRYYLKTSKEECIKVSDLQRPFGICYIPSKKQLWITDIEKFTVLKCFITNNRKYRSQQVFHKFSRSSGITYHPSLSLIAICDKGGEKNCSEVVLIKDDCSVYSRIATPFNPLFISVCSFGNFAFLLLEKKRSIKFQVNLRRILGMLNSLL